MPENDNPNILQDAPNPYDTSGEVAELQALQDELSQSEEAIEGECAKTIASQLNEADDELYFEDKEGFIKRVFALQNAWLKENIGSKQERAQELTNSINSKNEQASIDAAAQEFQSAHPEADIAMLMDFLNNEVPPRIANELQAEADPRAFFEKLYELFLQTNGQNPQTTQEPQEPEELPAQLQGVSKQADMRGSNEPMPMDRY
ncbi:hypothetical protein [Helicobacter sp. T3_23-1059]